MAIYGPAWLAVIIGTFVWDKLLTVTVRFNLPFQSLKGVHFVLPPDEGDLERLWNQSVRDPMKRGKKVKLIKRDKLAIAASARPVTPQFLTEMPFYTTYHRLWHVGLVVVTAAVVYWSLCLIRPWGMDYTDSFAGLVWACASAAAFVHVILFLNLIADRPWMNSATTSMGSLLGDMASSTQFRTAAMLSLPALVVAGSLLLADAPSSSSSSSSSSSPDGAVDQPRWFDWDLDLAYRAGKDLWENSALGEVNVAFPSAARLKMMVVMTAMWSYMVHVFPALRIARSFSSLQKAGDIAGHVTSMGGEDGTRTGAFMRGLAAADFFSGAVVGLLFMPPLAQNSLVESGMSVEMFVKMRWVVLIVAVLMRLMMLRHYVAAFADRGRELVGMFVSDPKRGKNQAPTINRAVEGIVRSLVFVAVQLFGPALYLALLTVILIHNESRVGLTATEPWSVPGDSSGPGGVESIAVITRELAKFFMYWHMVMSSFLSGVIAYGWVNVLG